MCNFVKNFIELLSIFKIPILRSRLFKWFVFSQCLIADEDIVVFTHFFKIVYTKVRIEVVFKAFTAVSKRFKLYLARNLYIFAQAISFILSKIACISDPERIPVYYFYLIKSIIDAINLRFRLFFEKDLSFAFLFFNLCDIFHSVNFRKRNIVSILIGMLYSIKQSDQSLLLITDMLDHPLERLLSIIIIYFMQSKICEINAACTMCFSPNEFSLWSSAHFS